MRTVLKCLSIGKVGDHSRTASLAGVKWEQMVVWEFHPKLTDPNTQRKEAAGGKRV